MLICLVTVMLNDLITTLEELISQACAKSVNTNNYKQIIVSLSIIYIYFFNTTFYSLLEINIFVFSDKYKLKV